MRSRSSQTRTDGSALSSTRATPSFDVGVGDDLRLAPAVYVTPISSSAPSPSGSAVWVLSTCTSLRLRLPSDQLVLEGAAGGPGRVRERGREPEDAHVRDAGSRRPLRRRSPARPTSARAVPRWPPCAAGRGRRRRWRPEPPPCDRPAKPGPRRRRRGRHAGRRCARGGRCTGECPRAQLGWTPSAPRTPPRGGSCSGDQTLRRSGRPQRQPPSTRAGCRRDPRAARRRRPRRPGGWPRRRSARLDRSGRRRRAGRSGAGGRRAARSPWRASGWRPRSVGG